MIDPDIHFRVLNILGENPYISQRDLSKKLNLSLGSVNYCLKALIQIGHIKIQNFQKNPKKFNYIYVITPKGVMKKSILLKGFLKRKVEEFRQLKEEIESIQLQNKETLKNNLSSKYRNIKHK